MTFHAFCIHSCLEPCFACFARHWAMHRAGNTRERGASFRGCKVLLLPTPNAMQPAGLRPARHAMSIFHTPLFEPSPLCPGTLPLPGYADGHCGGDARGGHQDGGGRGGSWGEAGLCWQEARRVRHPANAHRSQTSRARLRLLKAGSGRLRQQAGCSVLSAGRVGLQLSRRRMLPPARTWMVGCMCDDTRLLLLVNADSMRVAAQRGYSRGW